MRIITGGDPFWNCPRLAAASLGPPDGRYGPDVLVVHGDDTGIAESFALSAKGHRIKAEAHSVDFGHLGDQAIRFRNREMLRAGAGLCVIVCHTVLGKAPKDLARQAILAGIPTYLVEDERGLPRRLKAGDKRLD